MAGSSSTPWQPGVLQRLLPDIAERAAEGELVYVVVDDLGGGVAGLVVSRWPQLDEKGRLRFEHDDDLALTVDAERFHAMADEREPLVEHASADAEEKLRARPLLVGDVFAARLRARPKADLEGAQDPTDWLAPPLVDMSSEAREAAKAQYFAAVAGVLTPEELDEMVNEFREGEGPEDTEPGRGPDDEGPPAGPRGAGPGGTLPPSPELVVHESPTVGPWRPTGLQRLRPDWAERAAEGELVYVVVDDLDAGVAGLVVSRWPQVDEKGRLRFEHDEDVQLTVDADRFHRMAEQRESLVEGVSTDAEEELRERPLLVGDVFAARLHMRPVADLEEVQDPFDWLARPLIDMSIEARDAAKAQYFAAVAGVVTEEQLDQMVREFREGEGPDDTEPGRGPDDDGGGPSPDRSPRGNDRVGRDFPAAAIERSAEAGA